MNNTTLSKLSLIISLLGILLLLFISENINLEISKIDSITRNNLEQNVKINADVINVNKKDDLLFLKVKDETSEIDVVIFESNNLEINKGDKIEVQGKITLYKDNLEIIAKNVRQL